MIKYFALIVFGFTFFACNGNEPIPSINQLSTPTKKVTRYYNFVKEKGYKEIFGNF